MSKLVIVESPAKAHTIERYLGKGYEVKASMGHVRDLPKSKLGVDIENSFAPEYKVVTKQTKLVRALKDAAKKAEEVYMATDLDREGEAIAWHLVEALKVPPTKIRRVVFNEITRGAVQAAFASPRAIDMEKVNAQQARRILDRIVGYKLSPLLWRKVLGGLSAGRVQSVASKLVVDREREIEAFKPQEYWEIEARLRPASHRNDEAAEFAAKLARMGKDKAQLTEGPATQTLAERLRKEKFVVAAIDVREVNGQPGPPYTTSTLQQQASTVLRMRPSKTMQLAQQLYEGVELGVEGAVGLITYMRTDSVRVSDQAIAECREIIQREFGGEYLPSKPKFYKPGKRAQEAHEAIRPTSAARRPEDVRQHLKRDQFRLYELIWKRFVASQMRSSRRQAIMLEIGAAETIFTAEARVLLFDGHERVGGLRSKDVVLPELKVGDELKLMELTPSQHFTDPPPRFTEASLIRYLERLGIGRPSTFAPIVSTIQQRKYVNQMEGRLHATELGKLVTDELAKHFGDLINVRFTSRMEEDLDEVENGKTEWHELLRGFYGAFEQDLEKAMSNMDSVSGRETEEKCEKCGKPMVIRRSKHGLFLGCSGYPDCKSTRPLGGQKDGAEESGKVTEEKCEKCGKQMVIRIGRRGKFLGCSGYPECRGTRSLDGGPASGAEAGVNCDLCGKPMLVRRSRRGPFLGCSGYPECRGTKPWPKSEKQEETAGSDA